MPVCRIVPPGPECASQVLAALEDAPTYFPTEYKVPGGLSPTDLRSVLSAVVVGHELVGLETAEFEASEDAVARQAAIHTALEVLAPVFEGRYKNLT